MKRYDITGEVWEMEIEESPNGDWVKWDDVKELVDALKESRLLVAGICEEYKAYYVTLHKIDNVLNKIEGTK